MTLQETIQAKLDAARAEVSALEADLQKALSAPTVISDIDAIKEWFAALSKHMGG